MKLRKTEVTAFAELDSIFEGICPVCGGTLSQYDYSQEENAGTLTETATYCCDECQACFVRESVYSLTSMKIVKSAWEE